MARLLLYKWWFASKACFLFPSHRHSHLPPAPHIHIGSCLLVYLNFPLSREITHNYGGRGAGNMDKGPSSVVSLELTYGHRTSYGCSSLIICPVVFRSILGYDCLPWSRGLIIFSEGIGWNPCLMPIWSWMAYTVL